MEYQFYIIVSMKDSFLPLLPAWTGCLLIARFPVKAELRRRPELAGRPFAVTAAGSRPARVLAASPAAGVRSGQPVSEALSHCAGLLLLLPEDRLYLEQVESGLLGALRRVGARVEPVAPGLFYLNLSGMTALYGGLEGLSAAVLGAVGCSWRPRLGVSAGGKFRPGWRRFGPSPAVGGPLRSSRRRWRPGWPIFRCRFCRWRRPSWPDCGSWG